MVLRLVVALAIFSSSPSCGDNAHSVEDCDGTAKQDGNDLVDCSNPACAFAAACAPPCGNGRLDPGEKCDDGNTADGDACEANCTLPACGNGIPDPGEACDDGNTIDGDACESSCTLPICGNGIQDLGEACDDGNQINGDGCNSSCAATTIIYGKASNTRFLDELGTSIALSADGSTLAIGAPLEDSAATGINGNQTDSAASDAGAVYVFTRSGTTWQQQAYIKASNTHMNAQFGTSIALSNDGSTLVVGAIGDSSAATGIDGNQADNSATDAGAVYVFTRAGSTWTQQAYVKASNTDSNDQFGTSVALSADGSILAVGAIGESSAATGIGGNQADNSAASSGAVYVLTRSGTEWSQQAYLKASNTSANDGFGWRVALSADGSALAASAVVEDSAATGVDGNQADNSAIAAGAVYVFTRAGMAWSQQAYVKASNTNSTDNFGSSIALSADGSTLAVGALGEDSAATGIDGNQTNNAGSESGAVYVFTHNGTTWSQQAYIKASNTGLSDQFGWSIALADDRSGGLIMTVGAVTEDGGATGIGGDQADNSATASGAVYMFRRSGAAWRQQAYLKASNTGGGDQFGCSVAVSMDGTVAVGALGESSAATGIGRNQVGDPADDSTPAAGAFYVLQ